MTSVYRQRLAKIKARYPRAYEIWSQEDELLLIKLFLAGEPIATKADTLQRQPTAILSRLRKLNREVTRIEIIQPDEPFVNVSHKPEKNILVSTQSRENQTVTEPINILFSFQWQPVFRNVSEPYTFPQSSTSYMCNRYKWPAVYRWLVCKDTVNQSLLMYIG